MSVNRETVIAFMFPPVSFIFLLPLLRFSPFLSEGSERAPGAEFTELTMVAMA